MPQWVSADATFRPLHHRASHRCRAAPSGPGRGARAVRRVRPRSARAAAGHDPRSLGGRGRLPAGAARSMAARPLVRSRARLAAHLARDDRPLARDRPPAPPRPRAARSRRRVWRPGDRRGLRAGRAAPRPRHARTAARAARAGGGGRRAAALAARHEPGPDRRAHGRPARHRQVAHRQRPAGACARCSRRSARRSRRSGADASKRRRRRPEPAPPSPARGYAFAKCSAFVWT